nr:MAG TPA: Head Tail Connector Protein [Caudoviricetes sp.]
MAFVSYITYQEYQDLGGSLSEADFVIAERKAQRYLDVFTFDRIPKLTIIPDVVKECLVELTDMVKRRQSETEDGNNVTLYSNGVESIQYSVKSNEAVKKELYQVVTDWLPNYLVCRGVNFDVENYLQSADNNT